MRRRIIYIAIGLLLMIPLIGSYAAGSLISGCPSSIEAGDSVSFQISTDSEEAQELTVSISPAADSLSVSGAGASGISGSGCTISADNLEGVSSVGFSAVFSEAGTYTIKAQYGSASDSCTVTVTETEEDDSGDSGSDESDSDDNTDSGSSGENADSSSSGDDSSQTAVKTDDGKQAASAGKQQGTGAMPSGKMKKGKAAPAASGSTGTSSSSSSKTTYKGSADNYLKSLSVDGYEFTQTFNKTADTYFIKTGSGVGSVDVKAVPTDSDAEVVVTGADSLSSGRSKIMVTVTAENGDVRVYRIYADAE